MHPKNILEQAQNEGWALGAFNVSNVETLKAVVGAANNLRAPVIVESSHGETEFLGPENLVDLVANFRQETGLPIFVNLDHAPTVAAAEEGIAAGYEMIHINASGLPYEENVAAAKKVADEAHARQLLVEAELTPIMGTSAPHLLETPEEEQGGIFTDPEQAKDFVERTGVDTLAVSIGNVHGIYRTMKKLDIDLLAKLRSRLSCFFSLHGGSGIPEGEIKAAISTGKIVKINVNSELRIAYRQALEEQLKATDEVAVYKFMPKVIEAVQKIVEDKISLFGSAGKAGSSSS